MKVLDEGRVDRSEAFCAVSDFEYMNIEASAWGLGNDFKYRFAEIPDLGALCEEKLNISELGAVLSCEVILGLTDSFII